MRFGDWGLRNPERLIPGRRHYAGAVAALGGEPVERPGNPGRFGFYFFKAQIAAGYAWYAFQFAAELTNEQRLAYPEAERLARAGRIGLWQEPGPMPPWECRWLIRAKKREFCR